ncbi:hypothetical protein AB0L57_28465 [Nocardia sp. NPDC052254]|uniref:hypothetical protein n=1 Tax=Nocardia sp. NPDC052254 TaxID=3155681 RepID=UPI00343ABE31
MSTQWCVLIEEQVGGRERRQWELTGVEASGGGRAAAEQLADKLSRTYQPRNPLNPRGRTRYRTTDGWVVMVEGMMSEFHFRLTLAERMPG